MNKVTTKFINGYVITDDNQKIFYDHYKRGNSKVVVIAHGFFNSKSAVLLKELGQYLGKINYDVIILDFRGHGESPGLFFWTAKEYLDLTAILNYAHQQYQAVGVIGFSLGAATSIISASKANIITSLIAVSAPIAFSEIEYYFWEVDVKHEILYTVIGDGKVGKGVRPGPIWIKKDKPIDCIGKVMCPTMFLHGDDDWVIRHRHSVQLYNKAKCVKKLNIINNGPHAEYLIQRSHSQTLSAISDWFNETL